MTKDNLEPSDESGDITPESPEKVESPQSVEDSQKVESAQGVAIEDDEVADEAGEDLPGAELGDDDLADPGEYEIADDEFEAEELFQADETIDDTPGKGDPEDVVIDDEDQLAEAEAVARKATSTKPVKRKVTKAPVKKDRPTPKRDEVRSAKSGGRAKKRTTPAKFVKQSAGELRKVNWPTGDQLRQYFTVVLIFVLFIIAFVGGLDLLFGWGLLKLFGAK